jgi:hypothetical protein
VLSTKLLADKHPWAVCVDCLLWVLLWGGSLSTHQLAHMGVSWGPWTSPHSMQPLFWVPPTQGMASCTVKLNFSFKKLPDLSEVASPRYTSTCSAHRPGSPQSQHQLMAFYIPAIPGPGTASLHLHLYFSPWKRWHVRELLWSTALFPGQQLWLSGGCGTFSKWGLVGERSPGCVLEGDTGTPHFPLSLCIPVTMRWAASSACATTVVHCVAVGPKH